MAVMEQHPTCDGISLKYKIKYLSSTESYTPGLSGTSSCSASFRGCRTLKAETLFGEDQGFLTWLGWT